MACAKRYEMFRKIQKRASEMGLTKGDAPISTFMDLESADLMFKLRLEEMLAASDVDFAHDFCGIRDNINRSGSFPITDFGLFVPRFAGKEAC